MKYKKKQNNISENLSNLMAWYCLKSKSYNIVEQNNNRSKNDRRLWITKTEINS